MDIGKNILELRKKMNMSQAELAELLFVSSDLVSNWETGKRRPDWSTIKALASVFGVGAEKIADKNELIFSELENCLPDNCTIAENDLVNVLNDFLSRLKTNEANIFMRRYYFLCSTWQIAEEYGLEENHVRSILSKTRKKLRRFLGQVKK